MSFKSRHLLTEASRWKKEIQRNNLSDEALKTLRHRVSKSPEEITAGIHRGTDEILRKDAPQVKEIDNDTFRRKAGGGGILTQPAYGFLDFFRNEPIKGTSTLNISREPPSQKEAIANRLIYHHNSPLFSTSLQDIKIGPLPQQEIALNHAILRRHEALEGKYQKQMQDEYNTIRPPIMGGTSYKSDLNFELPTGTHQTYNVLKDEALLVNSLKHFDGPKNFNTARARTGEDESLKNTYGIGYDEINGDNASKLGKDIKKHERELYQENQRKNILKKIGLALLKNNDSARYKVDAPNQTINRGINYGIPMGKAVSLATLGGLGYLGKLGYDAIGDSSA